MMSTLLLAAITRFAVPATGEGKVLPDSLPRDAVKDAPCVIIAARGEYEGGSFVLCADENLGKVDMSVGPLKNEKGDIFPTGNLDLTTVKVWYQNSNAWISYFQDPELTLCPELLLHDEDLVKVDVAKKGNWARITGKGGEVDYFWLTAPRGMHKRDVDFRAGRNDDAFHCMQVGFSDSPKFAGATLERGKYKQFMLTAHVGKEVTAGLYRGTVKVVSRRSGEALCEVPVRLRVLDFELPSPKTYYDPDKDFISYFCEYVSMEWILASNGNDAKLAERQLEAILKNFVRHNEITPSFGESIKYKDLAERCGMDFKGAFMGQMKLGENAEARYAARNTARERDRIFGSPKGMLLSWGDEYRLHILRAIRDMVEIYHDEGFSFAVNSQSGFSGGANLADLWWPPSCPDHNSSQKVAKYNETAPDGRMGWYAMQHVGVENPAFVRRQYGMGPYLAGFSCNYNYAHHLQGWNDIEAGLYKPMNFVYGSGNGCIDTLAWEGFREAIDDIRYATLLKTTAMKLLEGAGTQARYAARIALKLLADAKGDNFDLATFRLEMIRHILKLKSLEAELTGKERAK